MEFFLLTIGAALVLAYIGASILKRLGIPQTLGFMLAGVVLGFTHLLTENTIHDLRFFVALALGLIGYNIGHELSNFVSPFNNNIFIIHRYTLSFKVRIYYVVGRWVRTLTLSSQLFRFCRRLFDHKNNQIRFKRFTYYFI